MVPMELHQALDLYRKVAELGVFGVTVLAAGDEHDHLEHAYSALVVLGQAFETVVATNADLTTLTDELSNAVQSYLADHMAPDDPPRGSLVPPDVEQWEPVEIAGDMPFRLDPDVAVAWCGNPADYWNNSGEINHEIAQQFGAMMAAERADSEARHPSNYVETSASEADPEDLGGSEP